MSSQSELLTSATHAADLVRSAHARSVLLALGLIVGGTAVAVGAMLPWLTLYAGLWDYRGTVGLYGWLTLSAGVIAILLGCVTFRTRLRFSSWIAAALGFATLLFALWLRAGLQQILHRPETVMLVARPGPGLFVILAGASLITATAILTRLSPSRTAQW